MANLTSQQANQIAGIFLTLAQSIGDYRYKNFERLSKSENQQIKELHFKILECSDNLYTLSATLVMNDIKESLASINHISAQINETYKTLESVQKAINIATSIIDLGAAIISKSPQNIADSIKDLKSVWNTA
ncbi:hypothetical protein OQX63_06420 [Pedobacter sp. PF22-3]|uniref:hypothetical protein n=1 Tax=Pedobacter sp. PF22-3 TaxID=2994467 RepID=UPI0022469D90|nr:hypothetical protein [Pedobacter sp. PF22-3]MCX2493099.1 hypothetical protein [Pedobacter sp. PF22-3]